MRQTILKLIRPSILVSQRGAFAKSLVPMQRCMFAAPSNNGKKDFIKECESSKDWIEMMAVTGKPTLVQAGASWCGPCVMLKPLLLEEINARDGAINYFYVDVDKNEQIASMLQISSIPVVYMVRNGDLIDEFMGVPKDPKKAIAAFVDKGLAAADSKDEKK